jgi:TatD DNase family protein
MSELVDSHSHIDVAEFDADRPAVLARARAAGVMHQIVPGITYHSFVKLRELCATEPGLHPAYGLHPTFLSEHRPEHLDKLAQWLERERPVAVGECGLDFFVDGLDAEMQRYYFQRQLELARDFDLPVIIHGRRAFDDVTAAVRRIGGLRGVVHSFSGSRAQASQLWKLGFCLGIGGPVTYERANRLRGVVAEMPIEFLMLETDAPDQPLHGRQGARNEPALLVDICSVVAALRGAEPAQIATATTTNCERVFGLARKNALAGAKDVAVRSDRQSDAAAIDQ